MERTSCDCNRTAPEADHPFIQRCNCGATRYVVCGFCHTYEVLPAPLTWSSLSCVECNTAACFPCAQRMRRCDNDATRVVCHRCDASPSNTQVWTIFIAKVTTSAYNTGVRTTKQLSPGAHWDRDEAVQAALAEIPPGFNTEHMRNQMRERYEGWFQTAWCRAAATEESRYEVLIQRVHLPGVPPLVDPRRNNEQ